MECTAPSGVIYAECGMNCPPKIVQYGSPLWSTQIHTFWINEKANWFHATWDKISVIASYLDSKKCRKTNLKVKMIYSRTVVFTCLAYLTTKNFLQKFIPPYII